MYPTSFTFKSVDSDSVDRMDPNHVGPISLLNNLQKQRKSRHKNQMTDSEKPSNSKIDNYNSKRPNDSDLAVNIKQQLLHHLNQCESANKQLKTYMHENINLLNKKNHIKPSKLAPDKLINQKIVSNSKRSFQNISQQKQSKKSLRNESSSTNKNGKYNQRSRNNTKKGYSTKPNSKNRLKGQSQLQLSQKREISRTKTYTKINQQSNHSLNQKTKKGNKSKRSRESSKATKSSHRQCSPISALSKKSIRSKQSNKVSYSSFIQKQTQDSNMNYKKIESDETKTHSEIQNQNHIGHYLNNLSRSFSQDSRSNFNQTQTKVGQNNKSSNQLNNSQHRKRLCSHLQLENEQIQKQLLTNKAELYEVKFKNQSLKSKISNLKKENQFIKNQYKLVQKKCEEAEFILKTYLSNSQQYERQQLNLLKIIEDAIRILASESKSQQRLSNLNDTQKGLDNIRYSMNMQQFDKHSNFLIQDQLSHIPQSTNFVDRQLHIQNNPHEYHPLSLVSSDYHHLDIHKGITPISEQQNCSINNNHSNLMNQQPSLYTDQIYNTPNMFDPNICESQVTSNQRVSESDANQTSQNDKLINQYNENLNCSPNMYLIDQYKSQNQNEDALTSYQLQFSQIDGERQQNTDIVNQIDNQDSISTTNENEKYVPNNQATNSKQKMQRSEINSNGVIYPYGSSNKDDINSTLTMQNILKANNNVITQKVDSNQLQKQQTLNQIITGVQSNHPLASDSSGISGSIKHQNLIQILQQAAGSVSGENAGEHQSMESLNQELNKLMKFGGTVPGLIQQKSTNANFTLNTALATALIAATQTETASGTNCILKPNPLEIPQIQNNTAENDPHTQSNQLETQSIGTYVLLSQLQNLNFKHTQQTTQQTEKHQSNNINEQNDININLENLSIHYTPLKQQTSQQVIQLASNQKLTKNQKVIEEEDVIQISQETTDNKKIKQSISDKEASQVKPSDMLIQYDQNSSGIDLNKQITTDCKKQSNNSIESSEKSYYLAETEQIDKKNLADMRQIERNQNVIFENNYQVFSERSFRPIQQEMIDDMKSPAQSISTNSNLCLSQVKYSMNDTYNSTFDKQVIYGKIQRTEEKQPFIIPQNYKSVQQEGIEIQIQDEAVQLLQSSEKPLNFNSSNGKSSNCVGFAGKIVNQLQILNVSAPENKAHHNDSIMMPNLNHLDNKKQSQQINGVNLPMHAPNEKTCQKSALSKHTDQKVKLLSNLYQCSEIEQQMSPENETDLTLLNHYNQFKGQIFAHRSSATGLQKNNNNEIDKNSEQLIMQQSNDPRMINKYIQPKLNQNTENLAEQSAVFSNVSQSNLTKLQQQDQSSSSASINKSKNSKSSTCISKQHVEKVADQVKQLSNVTDQSQQLNCLLHKNSSSDENIYRDQNKKQSTHLNKDISKSDEKDKLLSENKNCKPNNLCHVSHLSKLTWQPSNNSQCMHMSKISKDAESFGAIVDRDEASMLKDNAKLSYPEQTLSAHIENKGSSKSNIKIEQNSKTESIPPENCSQTQRDVQYDNNNSSYLVNIASGEYCARKSIPTSQKTNFERVSESDSNGHLNVKRKHIQDLYHNIIKNGEDRNLLKPRELRDKSMEIREMEKIKLNLEALKKNNQEINYVNCSDQSFQHPIYHSNMFDNITNTITSLGSNVTTKNQTAAIRKANRYDVESENDTQIQTNGQ